MKQALGPGPQPAGTAQHSGHCCDGHRPAPQRSSPSAHSTRCQGRWLAPAGLIGLLRCGAPAGDLGPLPVPPGPDRCCPIVSAARAARAPPDRPLFPGRIGGRGDGRSQQPLGVEAAGAGPPADRVWAPESNHASPAAGFWGRRAAAVAVGCRSRGLLASAGQRECRPGAGSGHHLASRAVGC